MGEHTLKSYCYFRSAFIPALLAASILFQAAGHASEYPQLPLEAAVLQAEDIYSPTCDIRGKPITEVEKLLASGADANEKNIHGNTALTQSLSFNDMNLLLLLLDYGADSNLLNEEGTSIAGRALSGVSVAKARDALNAMWFAQGLPPNAEKLFSEVVQNQLTLAFSHGIEIPPGYTEGHLLRDLRATNPATSHWRELRQNFNAYKAGAKFLAPVPKPPAMIAPLEDSELIKAIKLGDLKAVDGLLAQGHSPNQVSAYFQEDAVVKVSKPEDTGLYANTAVGVALHLKRFDIVHALLERGADPNIRGQFYLETVQGRGAYPFYGVPPLYAAVRYGDVNLVRDLLAHGADVNLTGCLKDRHPLAAADSLEMAKLLVSFGANVNFKHEHGSVLESFMRHGPQAKEIFTYLLNQGADPNLRVGNNTILHRALTPLQSEFPEVLISHGAEPDLRNGQNESSATMLARRKDAVAYLASKVSARKTDLQAQLLQSIAWGETPFVANLLAGQLEKVKGRLNEALWLAARKATAKHWDEMDAKQYSDLLRLLIDKGADPKQQDAQGNTLLHFARDPDLISFLVGSGVNVDAVNKKGETALEIAAKNGMLEKAATLALNGASTNTVAGKYPDFMKALQARLDSGKAFSVHMAERRKKNLALDLAARRADPIFQDYQRKLAAYRAAEKVKRLEDAEKEKPFDEAAWQKLLDIHTHSPCLKDRSARCLLGQVIDMKVSFQHGFHLGGNHFYSENTQADVAFLEAVINHGDKSTAQKLLALLPAEAEAARMRLLFLTGDYDLALEIAHRLQETKKSGTDYGATWALMQGGDINKALEIAKIAMKWQYTDLNPPPAGQIRSVRSGYCESNVTSSYPRSIGVLSNRFADTKNYDKAHEIVNMLLAYWRNNLNGNGYYNCNWTWARWAYEDAAFGLAEAYSKNDKKDEARKLFSEIQSNAGKMGISASLIAQVMKKSGFEKEALAVVMATGNYDVRDSQRQTVREDYDVTVIALGMGGAYAQAIKRLGGLSDANIKLNTYIALAQKAAQAEQKKLLVETLSDLSPLLGKRTSPLDNVMDYLDFAGLQYEAGQKKESRAILQTALGLYEPLRSDYLYERFHVGAKTAGLFAKLGDYTAMTEFMRKNVVDYNGTAGSTFTTILYSFAEQDRWEDFDTFLENYTEVFKQKGGDAFVIRGNIGDLLISKKQFDRYLALIRKAEKPELQYRHYRNFVVAGLQKDNDIPELLFSDMWAQSLRGCKSRREQTAERKIIGCYLELVGLLQDNAMFAKARGDFYR
jgi:ankyrin repeat protein